MLHSFYGPTDFFTYTFKLPPHTSGLSHLRNGISCLFPAFPQPLFGRRGVAVTVIPSNEF